MKATIERPLNPGKTGLEKVTEEAVIQMRNALNMVGSFRADVTTAATGALTPVWTSEDLGLNTDYEVTAKVVGSSADLTVYASYVRVARFARATGAAAQLGATQAPVTIESAAGLDATISLSGNAVVVSVDDDALGAVRWRAYVEVRSLL